MKTSKKFLAIIIPLLVIIPMLVGYSLWLVGEKKEEIPTYTFKDLLENNITLNATYTGSPLDITKGEVQKTFKVNFDIDWNSFYVTYWDKDGNETNPINAGEYKVKITSIYEEVVEGVSPQTAELDFKIEKATPIIDVSKIIVSAEEGKQYITSSSEISKLTIKAEKSAANHNGVNVEGNFTLKEQQLEVGKKEYSGIFTPTLDEVNFTKAEFKISINVYATVKLELGSQSYLTAGSDFSDNNTLYIDITDDDKNKLNLSNMSNYILPAIHYDFIADEDWFVKDNVGNVAVKWDFNNPVSSDLCLVAVGEPINYTIGYEVGL